MTRLLLALSATFFAAIVAAAESAQSTALPFPNAQLPAAAKTADEAPRWNFTPGPATSATPAAATVPGGNVPATPSAPASTLNITTTPAPVVNTGNSALPISSPNTAATSNPPVETSRDGTATSRPLQSVMKRRQAAAAAPTGTIEAPATQPAANVKPIQIDSPFNNANETAPVAGTGPAENSSTIGTIPYDAATSSQNERAATSTVPASNASPSPRYDFPLQLGPPPQTGDTAATAKDEISDGLRPVTSTPVLYPVPTNTATTGARQTAVFETPSQTAAVSSDVVQTSATQAVPPAAAASETAVDSQKVAATRATADLLATSSTSPPEPFYGANTSALSLAQALANTGESNRATAVNAYWRLSIAIRGYHWAVDELTRLEQIAARRGSFETSMLSTARAAAAARIEEAKIQVIRGQATLENLMAQSGQPLTYFDTKTQTTVKRPATTYMASDSPLVGPYRTYFDVLFANRAPPGRAKEIDRMLPIRWETINDRTAAVQSATNSIHYAEQAHAKGEADIRIVLACHEELYKQRRAFLDAVLNYNIDIADYAIAVAAPGTGNDKLVSMLIYTKQPDRVTSLPARAATSGVSSSTAVAAPTLSTTPTPAATTTRTSSDGWVPSSLHSLDPLAPRTTTAPRSNPASTSLIGNQPDPFKNLDNRYREFGR